MHGPLGKILEGPGPRGPPGSTPLPSVDRSLDGYHTAAC